uniref:Microtubule associated serine/threonine kinase 3 n=1 Tax=Nothobranchius korthausae TaxID=1143690 RepID=A0A1A8GB41_9TELE
MQITRSKSTISSLESQHLKLEKEVIRQQMITTLQDTKIILLSKKLARLHGDIDTGERLILERKISELNEVLDEKQKSAKKLTNTLKEYEDDDTNDDESSLELRQFSSVAHRFSKVVELLLKSGNKVTLQTTALENTSIKVGPARKASYKAKMARRSKKSKKDCQDSARRRMFKKISKYTPPSPMQSSRSFSSGFQQSSSDSLSGSSTHSLSPGPSTPCCSPAPDYSGDSSSSPCSSSPNSPVPQARPSSLHVHGRYTKAGRCKSTSSIPPSPLACIPPPQPLSPQCSPSCFQSHPKSLQGFHGKTLSPPTVARHSIRPRNVESPRSPLLKRVQSAEKLTGEKTGMGGYHGDRKPYSTRRHTVEMPLHEGEGLEDGDATTSFVCVGEHGRQGLCAGGQKEQPDSASGGSNHHRSAGSPQHRGAGHHSKEALRKLSLFDRRDTFKKQGAMQELNFDDLEEKEEILSPHCPAPQPKACASLLTSDRSVGEDGSPRVPQQKAKEGL